MKGAALYRAAACRLSARGEVLFFSAISLRSLFLCLCVRGSVVAAQGLLCQHSDQVATVGFLILLIFVLASLEPPLRRGLTTFLLGRPRLLVPVKLPFVHSSRRRCLQFPCALFFLPQSRPVSTPPLPLPSPYPRCAHRKPAGLGSAAQARKRPLRSWLPPTRWPTSAWPTPRQKPT